MDHNSYLYEQFVTTHRQELEREAEHYRLLAHVRGQHRHTIQLAVGKFGSLLVGLGTRLKQYEHQGEPALL